MRRTAMLTFAAALALTACTEASGPEAEGTGGEPASSVTQPAEPSASESPDPAATLTSPATRGTTAIPTAAATAPEVNSNPPGDECGASRVAAFVSQEATPAVRARLAAKVGHSRIRWVGPDTVVTMDFSPARLNVALDKANVITGGKCG